MSGEWNAEYRGPEYPPEWDEEDAEPIKYQMTFKFGEDYYQIDGEWDGEDWCGKPEVYLMNDDGKPIATIKGSVPFWVAATDAIHKKTYEYLERVDP